MPKIVAASGGFDPLHIGHVEYLEQAKSLGDYLIVIVNTDDFLMTKKGYAFMPLEERAAIVKALRCVDEVFICIDEDTSVCKSLEAIKPDIFAKGGDRNSGNIPEKVVCDKLGIQIIDGLGAKIQSSSDLVAKSNQATSSKVDEYMKASEKSVWLLGRDREENEKLRHNLYSGLTDDEKAIVRKRLLNG